MARIVYINTEEELEKEIGEIRAFLKRCSPSQLPLRLDWGSKETFR